MHLLLGPFLLFALFPFYHRTLTSLKQAYCVWTMTRP
jgi:hypothetical protein